MAAKPDKSLGQHWLLDREALRSIADSAEIQTTDTVLEIGPGLGTLTSELLKRAKQVIAVELDENLASKLPPQFPGTNLTVIQGNVLDYDLNTLPTGYKVVANIPYYITGKIVQMIITAENKPSIAVLLVQKEVAERLAAKPGKMSVLSVSTQVFAEVSLGTVVPAKLFVPKPKVDSQVVILKMRDKPLFDGVNQGDFFRVVKAGFSAKRKKLKTSLSGGKNLPKKDIETRLKSLQINPNDRAESLDISDWARLTKALTSK